jgi:hypothetical protein
MKKQYIIGMGILLIIVIFISFLFLQDDHKQFCEMTCKDVSKQLNSPLKNVFVTNNGGKLEGGCRCEFENGQIMGFGLDKDVN